MASTAEKVGRPIEGFQQSNLEIYCLEYATQIDRLFETTCFTVGFFCYLLLLAGDKIICPPSLVCKGILLGVLLEKLRFAPIRLWWIIVFADFGIALVTFKSVDWSHTKKSNCSRFLLTFNHLQSTGKWDQANAKAKEAENEPREFETHKYSFQTMVQPNLFLLSRLNSNIFLSFYGNSKHGNHLSGEKTRKRDRETERGLKSSSVRSIQFQLAHKRHIDNFG